MTPQQALEELNLYSKSRNSIFRNDQLTQALNIAIEVMVKSQLPIVDLLKLFEGTGYGFTKSSTIADVLLSNHLTRPQSGTEEEQP